MVEYDNFQASLGRLEEQYENHNELDEALPQLLREAVAESVIQRFKTCYDCLWKVLKRYLVEELPESRILRTAPSPFSDSLSRTT